MNRRTGASLPSLLGRRGARLALGLAAVGLLLSSPARADDFWRDWGDGKAELDGYALTQPRYGQLRDGTAVLVFVTEDMSDALRVKADPGQHPPSDVFPVLKLNFVKDFQTGIYDYNVMTSTFVKTEQAFAIAKSSFSSQEWCGHVYQQLLARVAGGQPRLVGDAHSYFDGEADQALDLPLPTGGLLEDALPILVRGLRGDLLPPGGRRTVLLLPTALRARLEHFRQTWRTAEIARDAESSTVATALGPLRAFHYTVTEAADRPGVAPLVTRYLVEEAPPHRLLEWTVSTGEEAHLLGSARLPYWQLHDRGDERMLKLLGLRPPPPRPTPSPSTAPPAPPGKPSGHSTSAPRR